MTVVASPAPQTAPPPLDPAIITLPETNRRAPLHRPPRVVWLAVALFGLVTVLWTVAVPAFRAPDEAAHLDLVLYLAEGNGYPSYDGRYFGEALDLDIERHLVDARRGWPRFDADDAVPRGQRPDVDDRGGVAPDADARSVNQDRPDYPYIYNQMPQHPPLYYMTMARVLQAERWLLPGHDRPSLDRELGFLRLVNVLLVLPLPLLAWATVMRLTDGAEQRAGVVAALLPLGLPQLTHIGGSLNNDNLFALLGGILTVLLVGVARGRRSWPTDLGVGAVLGLALLTKAFALMFVPWVVAAYLFAGWTTRRWRESSVGLAVAGAVSAAIGAWFWISNWVREGEPAPTTESLTRTRRQLPAGFVADAGHFLEMFSRSIVSRTWAWVGYRSPKFELDGRVVAVLSVAVLVSVLVALWLATPGLGTRGGVRRWDVVLAWLPVLLLGLFIARRAWSLYQTTGMLTFTQGRYLFAGIVAPMAVIGIGVARTLQRGAVVVVLAVVLALQVGMLTEVVQGSWTGDGTFGALSGALAWSPWPPAPIVLTTLAAAGAATAIGMSSVGRLGRRAAQGKIS